MKCTLHDTRKIKNNKIKGVVYNMIETVSFKGVFTLDEHIRVLGELNAMNSYRCGKKYDCEIYKDQRKQIHIDLKQNNKTKNEG